MRRELVFPSGVWPALKDHLLGQGQEEQLAFLLAGVAQGRGWKRLLVREVIPVPPDAFERQSSAYLAVKQTFSRAVLQRCYDGGLNLVEVHSHPFASRNVSFSDMDLANEMKKFRYVARKIPNIHHATMVVGQGDLDAHLWDRRRRRPLPFDRVRLLGSPVVDLFPNSRLRPGQRCAPLAPWLDRQVLAFGEAGQRRLRDVRVGVVGCGGTGAVVVQMLAYLGVRNWVLVDPDRVEVTNLNRLVGATRVDARLRRFKVRVAGRAVRRINPRARVQVFPLSANDPAAMAALKGVDVLFGCTDNHGSRLCLNQLAVQYLIPYLDLGAGLRAASDGGLATGGGQVRRVLPGEFCLACIDGIDRVKAAQDMMSPVAWRRQVARGYIQNVDMATPAVLFLNSAVAALAVAEFVNLWTGYRAPVPLIYFNLLDSQLTSAEAERNAGCIACGAGGSLALGDLQALPGAESGARLESVPAANGWREVESGKAYSG